MTAILPRYGITLDYILLKLLIHYYAYACYWLFSRVV
jgi:hypothetical protein